MSLLLEQVARSCGRMHNLAHASSRKQLSCGGSEEKIKNISEKVGKFLALEIDHKSDRIHHAIHHNFTTKRPPLRTTFFKTTLKNTSKTAAFPRLAMPDIFLKT
jgi:hypothetical protein